MFTTLGRKWQRVNGPTTSSLFSQGKGLLLNDRFQSGHLPFQGSNFPHQRLDGKLDFVYLTSFFLAQTFSFWGFVAHLIYGGLKTIDLYLHNMVHMLLIWSTTKEVLLHMNLFGGRDDLGVLSPFRNWVRPLQLWKLLLFPSETCHPLKKSEMRRLVLSKRASNKT